MVPKKAIKAMLETRILFPVTKKISVPTSLETDFSTIEVGLHVLLISYNRVSTNHSPSL